MKKNIHPKLQKTVVSCTCGETFETISTKETIRVEICSKCHPFFSGKKKIVDTGGRLDRFRKRYKQSQGAYRISEEEPESEPEETSESKESE